MKLQWEHLRPVRMRRAARLTKEYVHDLDASHYESSRTVMTMLGIIMVSDLLWENNKGMDRFTVFTTVYNGYIHTSFLNRAKLNDTATKRIAMKFILHVNGLNKR